MANQPIKKKYTIWSTLKDQGYYRVFNCPQYPQMWGEEKKITYKHKATLKVTVNIVEGDWHLGAREFDNLIEAHQFWVKTYGQKK